MTLTKSKYVAGMQCPKFLWLDRNMPEQKKEQDDTRMLIGKKVGELAMSYFGEYSEIVFDPQNFDGMLSETKRLLESGTEIITEAAFSHEDNFCIVDILRKVNGGYEIIEVKSSTGTKDDEAARVDTVYLDDMAYQYYVLKNCGLNITKVCLMRLNSGYTRSGALDLQQLFVLTDCTELILTMQEGIQSCINHIKAIAMQKDEPEREISSSCKKTGCAYADWCFRHLPENNVFQIDWSMWGSKKDAAYREGYVTFEDMLGNPTLNEQQLLQIETAINNLPPHIEPHSIRQFLSGLSYPLYHLDFETFQQAIPLYDGVKPYQQIPFQYSLHIQDKSCEEPVHKEFLAKEGQDPRRALSERLCADIPPDVCVLAYNAPFEKTQIKNLAKHFPDLAEHLMRICGNIQDLAVPFKKGYYYCREMGGSYSIKAVLSALCGDDPELDYNKLELIQNGGDAMNAFAALHEQSPEEIVKIRAALLAYCKLDTLAMVKVLEKLYEMAANI